MSDRAGLHGRFVARFHVGRKPKPKPIAGAPLDAAEAALGMLWPSSYRDFVTAHGAVFTPGLLDLAVAQKANVSAVQEFLKPSQATVETKRWRKFGLPEDCVAFAVDGLGSFFAFRALPASDPRPDDAPVWLFDHDEGEVAREAESFDRWLERYLAL